MIKIEGTVMCKLELKESARVKSDEYKNHYSANIVTLTKSWRILLLFCCFLSATFWPKEKSLEMEGIRKIFQFVQVDIQMFKHLFFKHYFFL